MKKYMFLSLCSVLASVFTLSFTSCNDDDEETPAKPVVTLTEVGHENLRQAHPGHDLHLEADIVAMGLIKSISIEIHQEEGGSYEIEKTYTEGTYIGVLNATFHEHIDIPADAPLGEYHLHFTVTDSYGQQTTAESPLLLTEGDGDDDDDHHHE